MSQLRNARDSFVHFLNDNLPNGMTCHAIRRDPNSRGSDVLEMNAVNVSFLNMSAGNGAVLDSQQVAIDICNDDENTAVDAVDSVYGMLRSAFYTPMFDYTNPTAPVATGTNVMWERHRITFKRVAEQGYCYYTCLLSLRFQSL